MNWFEAHGELSAGAVEALNLKAKLTIRKPSVSARLKASKPPCITNLVTYQSINSPTNSADEAKMSEQTQAKTNTVRPSIVRLGKLLGMWCNGSTAPLGTALAGEAVPKAQVLVRFSHAH